MLLAVTSNLVIAGRYILSIVNEADITSLSPVNAVAPAVTVLVMVTVSVLALVVNEIPVPATNVNESVAESATTELCPATTIV